MPLQIFSTLCAHVQAIQLQTLCEHRVVSRNEFILFWLPSVRLYQSDIDSRYQITVNYLFNLFIHPFLPNFKKKAKEKKNVSVLSVYVTGVHTPAQQGAIVVFLTPVLSVISVDAAFSKTSHNKITNESSVPCWYQTRLIFTAEILRDKYYINGKKYRIIIIKTLFKLHI